MGAETELKEESTCLPHQKEDCSEQPKKDSFLKKLKKYVALYYFGSGAKTELERKAFEKNNHFTRVPTIVKDNGSPPYFTVITITICVVAYVVYNCGKENPEAIDQSLQNSLWIVDGKQDWKTCWTFFTYSFLHADFWHLAPNMMILLPVGVFLEYGHSSYRPAIVYFMGCILGGMLSGIVAPGVFLLGSSGGVYAITFAHIADLIINGDILEKKSITFRLAVLSPIVWLCLVDAYRLSSAKIIMDGAAVSYAAHVAGGFTGLFCGTFLLTNFRKEKWEKILRRYFVWIYAFVFGAVTALSLVKWNLDINSNLNGIVNGTNTQSGAQIFLLDTIKSLDNPEFLINLHAESVQAQKKMCDDIYITQQSHQDFNTISSASVASKSPPFRKTCLWPVCERGQVYLRLFFYKSPPVLLIKRTVNVEIKQGGKQYKCKFIYYAGCESSCKKVDKCLKDQGLRGSSGSTCQNKKKNEEGGGSEAMGTDRSHSNTRRHSRRIGTRIGNLNSN